jgi:hypothetical protein
MKSSGVFRYSPRTSSIPNPSKWWLVIDCDEELARYYRSLCNWENRASFKLNRPAWGSHISVIADELPPKAELWNLYAGEIVEFEYEPILQNNGQYFWFSVKCNRAHEIRVELGLARDLKYPLHLTIGIDLEFKYALPNESATGGSETKAEAKLS